MRLDLLQTRQESSKFDENSLARWLCQCAIAVLEVAMGRRNLLRCRALVRMARSARPPWKRSNPRKRARKASTHLTPKEKSAARSRAKRAGRRYPNLVDNMGMAA